MATMITEECINCGACEPECPNEAISSIGDLFVIDPVLCTECVGFHDVEQCAAVCPVDCCVEDPNNPEPEALLVQRAREIHPEAGIGEEFPSRFRGEGAAAPSAKPAAPASDAPPTDASAAPVPADAAAGVEKEAAGEKAPVAAPAKLAVPEAKAGTPLVPAAISKAISQQLKSFLDDHLASGELVTVAVGKDQAFTGRIFRLMLEEGWIAVEHEDGRRRAFYIITGGSIKGPAGEVPLPS